MLAGTNGATKEAVSVIATVPDPCAVFNAAAMTIGIPTENPPVITPQPVNIHPRQSGAWLIQE